MASILEIILRASGGDSVKSELGKVTGGADVANKIFGKLGEMLSVGVLAKGIKDSIVEFGKQEQAIIKLNSALKNQGVYTEANAESFQRQASELMNLTTFTDDAITSGQALAMNMGVQAETIKQITPLVLDFASAMGMDLESAFRLMGKAALGESDMLKRYGIIVDEDKLKTEGFNAVIEVLQNRVGGTAELLAKSGTGQLTQFKNNIGEIKEAVGEGLVPVLASMSKFILVVGKDLTGTNKETENWVNNLKNAKEALNENNLSEQKRIQLLKFIKQESEAINKISELKTKIYIPGEMKAAKENLELAQKNIAIILENGEKEINQIKLKVKLSEEEQKKMQKYREEEAKVLETKVEKSKDQIEKEYDLRRELRQLDLEDVIANLEKEIELETKDLNRKMGMERALQDYKNALGIENATKIKEVQDSINSTLESNLTDMLLQEKTFGEGVGGIWEGLKRIIIETIVKTVIEEKAAAVIRIAAEQAVAAAKALSAYSGIPFIGIVLGIAAAAAINNEINKNKNFQGGGVVPGAEGVPVQATVHGGERVLTPQQQRMGMGGGVQIGKIEIIFPEVTSFSDWMNASPAIIKQVTERKILQALSSLEDEGKVKEGTVLI